MILFFYFYPFYMMFWSLFHFLQSNYFFFSRDSFHQVYYLGRDLTWNNKDKRKMELNFWIWFGSYSLKISYYIYISQKNFIWIAFPSKIIGLAWKVEGDNFKNNYVDILQYMFN